MANTLKMANINAIESLISRGWSFRRIARELGIHRETVARYAKLASKPAISTTGRPDSKPANPTTGNEAASAGQPPLLSAATKRVNLAV